MSGGLVGLGASIALKASGVSGFLKRVPPWIWYVVAALALFAVGGFLHHRAVGKHDTALVQTTIVARDKAWQARFDAERAKAEQIAQQVEALQSKIAANIKETHDAQVSNNAALAHALSVRGPGKAAAIGCRPIPYSPIPTTAGGPQQSAPGSDDPATQVPTDNGISGLPIAASGTVRDSALALVPWRWLTDQGQSFDDLLAEAHAWRDWWPKEQAAYESMRQRLLKQAGDKPR